MSADPENLAARLRAVPTAEMSDTLEAAGLRDQVLASDLAPVAGQGRFAGPALCLSGAPGPEPGLGIAAMDAALFPGAAVLVGSPDQPPRSAPDRALVGGNMAASWRRLGMAALIVDGPVRDLEADSPFPVRARGRSPRNCRGVWRFLSVSAPLALPGASGRAVHVRPGDWIHGDEDGILVLPREHLPSLLEDAEEVGRIERRMRAEILSGADRARVYAENPRFLHVRPAGRAAIP